MKNKLIESVTPFMIVGFAIATMIGLLLIIANVVIWGLVIGGGLWALFALKYLACKYFLNKQCQGKGKGIIIEHNDVK